MESKKNDKPTPTYTIQKKTEEKKKKRSTEVILR
jgi:hypothetical protein